MTYCEKCQQKIENVSPANMYIPNSTYGYETWVLRKFDIKKINAYEIKCYRKITRIRWIADRTKSSILN